MYLWLMYCCCSASQSCLTLCDPMDNDISILYLLCQDTFKTLLLIVIAKTELTTSHHIPQYAGTYLLKPNV